MRDLDIAPEQYGPRTEDMRAHIDALRYVTWFPPDPAPSPRDRPTALVTAHLQSLRNAGARVPPSLPFDAIEGDLDVLKARKSPDPWGDRWQAWRTELNRVVDQLHNKVQSTGRLSKLIAPPLWPVQGQSRITQPLLADWSVINSVPHLADQAKQDAAWALLCGADQLLWYAMLWDFSQDNKAGPNPFSPLLELYELGWYPLGWEENHFQAFRYAPAGGA